MRGEQEVEKRKTRGDKAKQEQFEEKESNSRQQRYSRSRERRDKAKQQQVKERRATADSKGTGWERGQESKGLKIKEQEGVTKHSKSRLKRQLEERKARGWAVRQ